MKKCWLLLLSIKAVIGQFSSKWPGPSSRTVKGESYLRNLQEERGMTEELMQRKSLANKHLLNMTTGQQ